MDDPLTRGSWQGPYSFIGGKESRDYVALSYVGQWPCQWNSLSLPPITDERTMMTSKRQNAVLGSVTMMTSQLCWVGGILVRCYLCFSNTLVFGVRRGRRTGSLIIASVAVGVRFLEPCYSRTRKESRELAAAAAAAAASRGSRGRMSDDNDEDDESTGAMSHVLGSSGSGAGAVAVPGSRQSQRSSFLSLIGRDDSAASCEGPSRHRNGSLLTTVDTSSAGGSNAPLPLPLPFRHGPLQSNDSRTSLRASSQVSDSERTDRTAGSSPGASGPTPRLDLALRRKCCAAQRCRKVTCGVLVTCCVAVSWVCATHFVKGTYNWAEAGANSSSATVSTLAKPIITYRAPFFTTWFCTLWTGLFFPLYLTARLLSCSKKSSLRSICKESVGSFREKGLTVGKFFGRCSLFCLLWVVTNYMYIHALRILDTTDVMALYSSNVSFVYLLSWVVLHYQFVGVRIVAVILCSTGIALLAYMDGLVKTPTLGGVLLGAASSAGSAVYKVMFKKLFGDAGFGEVALFFTLIGLFSTLLLWPMLALLYFTGAEVVTWDRIPWKQLTGAAGLSLVTNLLGNFGVAITYEIFITLGLVVAVPISAAMDSHFHSVKFAGMKLSGIVLIAVGFFLALFPENWPDYVTKVIRWRRRRIPREELARHDGSAANRSRLRSSTGLIK